MPRTPKKSPKRSRGKPWSIVKRGSVSVKIYRVKHAGARAGVVYTVAWHAGRGRQTRQFADPEQARFEAALKADQIAAGMVDAARAFSGDDARVLDEARRTCGQVPILAALDEWKRARDLCHGQLIPAAQAWRDANSAAVRTITVDKAVDQFLASRVRAGKAESTYRLLTSVRKSTRTTFKQDFAGRPMNTVTATHLEDWIHRVYGNLAEKRPADPVTHNTVRKRLVALWRWARKQGFLPRTVQTEAERMDTANEPTARIGILDVLGFALTLEEVRTKHPEYLGAAVLAGFCGLRRTEVHAQLWADVELERAFVRVTAAKLNTPSRRIVPLSPAAVEWLKLAETNGGSRGEPPSSTVGFRQFPVAVSPAWGIDRVRTFAKAAGIPCPENGFRHAFISHRVAQTGNVAETALEAGNSPAIVFRHYRELVTKDDGKAWFELTPARTAALAAEHAAKVVPKPTAGKQLSSDDSSPRLGAAKVVPKPTAGKAVGIA